MQLQLTEVGKLPNGAPVFRDPSGNFYIVQGNQYVQCDQYGNVIQNNVQQNDGFNQDGIKVIGTDRNGNPDLFIDRSGNKYILDIHKRLTPFNPSNNNNQIANGYGSTSNTVSNSYNKPSAYNNSSTTSTDTVTPMSYNDKGSIDTDNLFIDTPQNKPSPKYEQVPVADTVPKTAILYHSKYNASLLPLYDETVQELEMFVNEQQKAITFKVNNKG